MRVWTIIAGGLTFAASPLAAQEVRDTPEDHTPPPASLEQMRWLIGEWRGKGIGDAPAVENWLAPTGTTMVGTFIQQNADGSIMFTEHMYLMEEDGSLVLRLKHFNADLTAWEDREGMVTFPLIAAEECAAYFRALTLRCDGKNGLVAAVRMKSAGGEISEMVFRFDRVE